MSYYSYTILECTNPDLISSGSTFVKESLYSFIVKIENGKSHFLTNCNTMDSEIAGLSMKHPNEIFIAESHWDLEFENCVLVTQKFINGKSMVLGIEPGYFFDYPDSLNVKEEEKIAFQNHVLGYLKRLDKVKLEGGFFEIDQLNNNRDKCGYESYIIITYENEFYKWIATKKYISYIKVSVEKKEPIINPLKEYEDNLLRNRENENENKN
jgi:hypothetical protein